MDEVFVLSLKDGAERQISHGFGHRYILSKKRNKAIWDDNRYGTRAIRDTSYTILSASLERFYLVHLLPTFYLSP